MKPRIGMIFFGMLALCSSAAGLAVMSVDFGSEFVKIAIVKPGVPMEIVLNKESDRKTATIVSLRDGERQFGEPAINTGLRYPKSAYRYLLDLLGKHYDNPLVARYHQRFPYYDMVADPDTGAVVFKNEDGVQYGVEELVGMILQKAKEYAETFTDQPISEAVVTVPAYFNQAERRAMGRAAELAGLKLLQLLNDNTAVALNYGVFRRKVFNATAVHYMFFDMGASSTSATIVSYQVVKVKLPTSGVVDTFPQLTVRGVGFDRTLGGAEFQQRLTDHLAKLFNAQKKNKKTDVMTDVRAMRKLYKEAGRVKHVLSANVDHFAQVEGLLDDEDFRAKVTREEFEGLCADLFPRVETVVKAALDMAQITMPEISEVILMGGGTRVPQVQQVLQKAIGREELGKGINSDEAAALGAVYQAAHLGKGFKVKKFGIKEATIYPIQVEFERARSPDDTADDVISSRGVVKRTLFGRAQTYPQKKVMTFNKHVKDFSFDVTYADLGFLTDGQLRELGNVSLQTVSLAGVEDAYSEHGEGAESKGVKAHFRMDDSGLLYLDKVECLFEKTAAAVAESEESTLSKIGNTISNLFGGGSKADEGMIEESREEPSAGEEEKSMNETSGEESKPEGAEGSPEEGSESSSASSSSPEASEETNKDKESEDDASKEKEEKEEGSDKAKPSKDKKVEDKKESKEDAEKNKADDKDSKKKDKTNKKDAEEKDDKKLDEEKKEEEEKKDKKPKLVTLKADIKTEIVVKDVAVPSDERFKESKKLMSDLRKKDEEKDLLEKAKNEIEAFVFEFSDRLEEADYKRCSTEEERLSIVERLSTVTDWLNEQDDSTPRKDYENKLKDMKSVTRDLHGRVKELRERPGALEALNGLVNHTEHFLAGMKNYTGPEDKPFTQVEYDALDKLINETKEWNRTMWALQAKAPLTEKPKFTAEDVAHKLAALDREVKYLINKAKIYRPKAKPKAKEGGNKTESTGNYTKAQTDAKIEEVMRKIREAQAKSDKLDRDILEGFGLPTGGSEGSEGQGSEGAVEDEEDTFTLGEDDGATEAPTEEKGSAKKTSESGDNHTDKPTNDEL